MSRQQRYQLKHKQSGLCVLCSRKVVEAGKSLCSYHLAKRRMEMRARLGLRPWHAGGPGRPSLVSRWSKG